MSLLKSPRKKAMREYYIKPPAKGGTTAYVCYQYYDRAAKRTKSIPYVSFNMATNPDAPETNTTDKGKSAGYALCVEHLADIKQWLKKNGTFGKPKVPARVLARIRAEVEYKVRAELGAPPLLASPAIASEPRTAGDKIRTLCEATDELLEHITTNPAPKEILSRLTREELFALRLHLNFGEKALRSAFRSAGVTATEFAPAALPAEATEALRRGYITELEIETARQGKARSDASKAAKTRKGLKIEVSSTSRTHD